MKYLWKIDIKPLHITRYYKTKESVMEGFRRYYNTYYGEQASILISAYFKDKWWVIYVTSLRIGE